MKEPFLGFNFIVRFNDWSLEREELDGSFLAPTQKPTSHDASDDLVFDANAPMDFDDDGGIGADFVGADDFFDNDDANNGDVVFNDKRDEFKDGGILSKGKLHNGIISRFNSKQVH